jgi:hypothetical protein
MTGAGLAAGQFVQLKFNFTGSANGIADVVGSRALPYIDISNGTGVNSSTNQEAPNVAFADTYSDSNPTPIDPSTMDDSIVGAPVFAFIRSPDTTAGCTLGGITNISREQAELLATDNGPSGMPATFLGGSSSSPVYLIGRDQGSGTRITTDRNIRNTAGQNLWFYYGVSGVYYGTNTGTAGTYGVAGVENDGNTRGVGPGFLSGGDVGTVVKNSPSSIGYVGLSDNKGAQILTFEGAGIYGIDSGASVTYPLARLAESGAYPFWSYEHVYNVTGALSTQQIAVRDWLISKIKNVDFQNSTAYANNNARLVSFQVDRGGDGGTITRGNGGLVGKF